MAIRRIVVVGCGSIGRRHARLLAKRADLCVELCDPNEECLSAAKKLAGVSFAMPEFLAQASDRIPTLTGIKATNSDLMSYQLCLRAEDGQWDIPWGVDEYLLAALALGAKGAVGSSFNFAAPIYRRLMTAQAGGDTASAREEQFRSVRLIQLLAGYGYMAAAKALMGMLGVPVGPSRLPSVPLTADANQNLAG